jgi:hypothetical protein
MSKEKIPNPPRKYKYKIDIIILLRYEQLMILLKL